MGLSLLPSTPVDFGSEGYWDYFFAKKEEGFEWYGDYEGLAPSLRKWMNVKDNILVVGCGNSNLSECLYNAGYESQRNIDISRVVIKKMRKRAPYLIYEEDDVTNLSSSDEEFSCILDKGTFDALAPPPPSRRDSDEDAEQATEKSRKMLHEIRRVLKPNGRFICISLLQKHVAEILFRFFIEVNWIIQITRCPAAETQTGSVVFPVYICSFNKIPPAKPGVPSRKSPIIFFGSETQERGQRLDSLEEILVALQRELCSSGHVVAMKTMGYYATREGGSCPLEDKDGTTRYLVYPVDLMDLVKKNPLKSQFGIFIVPQGRETDFMYNTHEGRLQLARQANYARLCVVHLQRDQEYLGLDGVRAELGASLKFLMPDCVAGSGIEIAVMSLGVDAELRKRDVIYKGNSPISGDYFVEDIHIGKDIFRRLIFTNASSITQSEVPIKVVTKKIKIDGKTKTVEEKIPVPHQSTCDHHGIMTVAFSMLNFFLRQDESETKSALLIGLGGGLLVSLLHHCFPSLRITAVELDGEIVEVASMYFELPKISDKFSVVVEDGLKYIRETDQKYNVILFDVDSKSTESGLSCPPKEFLSDESLVATKNALSPAGIFVLNLVCRNSKLDEEVMRTLLSHFPFIYRYKLVEDLNTVLLCFAQTPLGNPKQFAPLLRKSVRYVRDIQVQGAQGKGAGAAGTGTGKDSNVPPPKRTGKSKKSKVPNPPRGEEEEEACGPTGDNLMTLTEDGIENMCARFQLLRTKNL